MKRFSVGDRVRYAFDNAMSRGTTALVGWLFVLSAGFVVLSAGLVTVVRIAPPREDGGLPGYPATAWTTLMHAIDPGTITANTGSRPYLLAMFLVTLGGIFVVSTFIGLITSGIQNRVAELRRGRSFVVEEDHTIVLGWSPQVFTVLSELVAANAEGAGTALVLLAEKDKAEMDDELRERLGPTGRTRVVCRTGNPVDGADLALTNPDAARSIIVLPPEGEDPDAQVIKSILALTGRHAHGSGERPRYHIVAGLRDPRNLEAARLLGNGQVQLLAVEDVISRITVQTCRQSGLSVVYTELLDFGGDEIYLREEPAVVGLTFGEAQGRYRRCTLLGLLSAEGELELCPDPERRIARGEQVVAIARDEQSLRVSEGKPPRAEESAIAAPRASSPKADRTLLLGWNRRGATIVAELDAYVAPGSTLTIVADAEALGGDEAFKPDPALRNLEVRTQVGDITDRRVLDALDLGSYEHVITLSYSDHLRPEQADARTLVTLLHLRDIARRMEQPFTVVSEMLDVRNRELAAVTQADDFIVSDKLVSLMLSQVSQNAHLAAVFAQLFDPAGPKLYLRPAAEYLEPGCTVDFYTVLEAARRRGEVALGYRVGAEVRDAARAFGVRVNPDKAARWTVAEEDRVLVLQRPSAPAARA